MKKALILAAGMGTRLAPITNDRPKSMVEVCGKPILFWQIDCLLENGVDDILVIAGYCADMLTAAVKKAYPGVKVLNSVDYATTNNMYSAYLGRDFVGGSGFLMMNADVCFDASVIRSLINHPAENAVVVDMGRYLEESMKVTFDGKRLTAISKTIAAEDALGSSIDVYKFSPSGGAAFFSRCREYIEEKGQKRLWSEVALNDAMGDIAFEACPVNGRWYEIDDFNDLDIALSLFKTLQKE